jgi:hypothetical protein
MYYFGGQLDFKSEGNNILYYYYEGTRIKSTTLMNAATKQTKPATKMNKMDINKAQNKMSHISKVALCVTLKTINMETTGVLQSCEGCAVAKTKVKDIPKILTYKADHSAEQLCINISGPYKKSIIGNNFGHWSLMNIVGKVEIILLLENVIWLQRSHLLWLN